MLYFKANDRTPLVGCYPRDLPDAVAFQTAYAHPPPRSLAEERSDSQHWPENPSSGTFPTSSTETIVKNGLVQPSLPSLGLTVVPRWPRQAAFPRRSEFPIGFTHRRCLPTDGDHDVFRDFALVLLDLVCALHYITLISINSSYRKH